VNSAPLPVETNQLVLDVQTHEVRVNGNRLQLTPTEFRLLSYLMSKAGQVIRKEELFRATWGNDEPLGSSQVALMVSRLRAKIEPEPDNPTLVTTVYGVGYQFNK
jgi:DNA-binding response OmpR family regulator